MEHQDQWFRGDLPMKKAFVVASISIWAIGLVIGIGFSIVGEITAVNNLPAENQELRREHKAMEADRNSIANALATERERNMARIAGLEAENSRWSLQNGSMIVSLLESRLSVTPSDTGLREE